MEIVLCDVNRNKDTDTMRGGMVHIPILYRSRKIILILRLLSYLCFSIFFSTSNIFTFTIKKGKILKKVKVCSIFTSYPLISVSIMNAIVKLNKADLCHHRTRVELIAVLATHRLS